MLNLPQGKDNSPPPQPEHNALNAPAQKVTWKKPLLLGKEELRPFLTIDQAAFKIQQLHRNWRAREVARDAMRMAWNRVYSPQVCAYICATALPRPNPLNLHHTATRRPARRSNRSFKFLRLTSLIHQRQKLQSTGVQRDQWLK